MSQERIESGGPARMQSLRKARGSLVGWALGVLALLVPAIAPLAAPVRLAIEPGSDGTSVVFASQAPMESFEGSTDQVSGYLVLDPSALGDSLEVRLEVDLASLDTGIALRNQHMRENHLETERFPRAVFTGGSLVGFPATLPVGETVQGKVRGSFDLHGVSRRIEAAADLTWQADGRLVVRATFEVLLADHAIDRPKFLVLKLDERQKITVDLEARPVAKEGSGE